MKDYLREQFKADALDNVQSGAKTLTEVEIEARTIGGDTFVTEVLAFIKFAGNRILNIKNLNAVSLKIRRELWVEHGHETFRYFRNEYLLWNGRHYEPMEAQTFKSIITAYLGECYTRVDGHVIPLSPTEADISNVKGRIESHTHIPSSPSLVLPIWLNGYDGGGWDAKDVIACRNGLVRLSTGEFRPHDPRFFSLHVTDFDFDPNAKCPRWEKFLEETHPRDDVAQETIEEALGYSLSNDMSIEKGFMLIGETRGGKGTIIHVACNLVGSGGYYPTSIHTWTRNENSFQGGIDKKVIAFSETIAPSKPNPASEERLLQMTAHDVMDVGRKYLGPWTGRHTGKIWLACNDPIKWGNPKLNDRWIIITFKRSFLDHEDPKLKDTLIFELPGIFNRALRAYQRLIKRNQFRPLDGSRLLREELNEDKPFATFCYARTTRGAFKFDPSYCVLCEEFTTAYNDWASERGLPSGFKSPAIGSLLRATFHGQIDITNNHPRKWTGIKLLPPETKLEDL